MAFLATALLALLIIPGPAVQAQTACTLATCTLTLANAGSPVVDGCGTHATPGRMKLTLESDGGDKGWPTLHELTGGHEYRRGSSDTFIDFEWRTPLVNANRWTTPSGADLLNFASRSDGTHIIEVRPKAGAHVWSNRNRSDPNQGPGELVVKTFVPKGNRSQYTYQGSAYFLFMGGKGCARVGLGGELLGGNQ